MDDHRLTYGFFWLLAGMLFCGAGALVVLNVNEVVTVSDGELLSERPRFVARAPYQAQVDTALVAEGDRVSRGQLLLVLKNDEVDAQLAQAEAEGRAQREQLAQLDRELGNAAAQVSAYDARIQASREQFRLEREKTNDGANALARQQAISRQQDSLATEGLERARTLFKQRVISKVELDTAQLALLDRRAASSDLEKRYGEQVATGNKLAVDARATMLQLQSERLTTDAARLSLVERTQLLRRAIEKQDEEIRLRQQMAAREQVRAEFDGTVRYVYNTKSARDFLDPGEVLVEVAPLDDEATNLYARLKVDQQGVKLLRRGQHAALRLDAFQYYKFGGLRGTLRYVSPPSDNNDFFAIVDLEPRSDLQLRPGYRVSGEIQVGRLPLYQLIVKKVFLSFEQTPVRPDSTPVTGAKALAPAT